MIVLDSPVGSEWLRAGQLRGRCLTPGGKIFSSSLSFRPVLGPTQALIQSVIGGSLPKGKEAGP